MNKSDDREVEECFPAVGKNPWIKPLSQKKLIAPARNKTVSYRPISVVDKTDFAKTTPIKISVE